MTKAYKQVEANRQNDEQVHGSDVQARGCAERCATPDLEATVPLDHVFGDA